MAFYTVIFVVELWKAEIVRKWICLLYVKNRKSADGEEVFRYERDGSLYRLIRGLELSCAITLVETKSIV